MTTDDEALPYVLVRVRVTTDGDPGILTRLLGYFQHLNVTPRKVLAEFGGPERMYLQIDVCGLPVERVELITAKMGQVPSVLSAYWHRLV